MWKLSLDKGIFRVFHEATGWRSLGSFAVSGERIEFFNDPHCHNVVGVYSWKLEGGQLMLQVVEDECGIDLRAKSFTALPWTSCQPLPPKQLLATIGNPQPVAEMRMIAISEERLMMAHKKIAGLIALIVLLTFPGAYLGSEALGPFAEGTYIADDHQAANWNVIQGFSGNQASPGSVGVTISGGGNPRFPNQITGDFGVVGGGMGNQAGNYAMVGGGSHNSAGAPRATVGGGSRNSASREHATVSGGDDNTASATRATVGGGYANTASSLDATVGGGGGNTASGNHATVAGGSRNTASGFDATIGGGSYNIVSGTYATVGGGTQNDASGFNATVGGGAGNIASGEEATIAGGLGNHATDNYGTVGGGRGNLAGNENDDPEDAWYTTVGGGLGNIASGSFSAVPGGSLNQAAGDYSLAAGRRAHIDAAHDGAFLYADANDFDFNSTAANEFAVRATGGVRLVTAIDSSGNPVAGVELVSGSGSWSSLSDREVKANIRPVDESRILVLLAELPVSTWNYTGQDPSIRHIGPMAQDFYAAFGVGEDDTHIGSVDADGVALAAIQALYELSQEQTARIRALEAANAAQQEQIQALEARLSALEAAAGIPGASGSNPSGPF